MASIETYEDRSDAELLKAAVAGHEDATALFVVPADYKIAEEKDGPFTIKLPPPAPPEQ